MILVDPDTVKKWDANYAAGSDKKYPNLDLVRLEKWFFKSQPGLLLEYAFGCGENLIHLLECGYTIKAIDASLGAKQLVERKLQRRPELQSHVTLTHLPVGATVLPYPDAQFDYVNCLSVLSLLGSKERAEYLLKEFLRVMKPGAKIIVDINGPQSDFARYAKSIGDNVYETREPGDTVAHRSYCPPDARTFAELIRPYFNIDDVGYSAHKYLHSEIQEFIICAHKE
ncbi:MAG: methyltransferase [Parcubacteria group bacterium GW2011_GWC2_45_7]|nr:MAG: methyltransferase [Parcubacteria group bacterium GW2011_GWC2_45_7]KKU74142.1 MAG: methyltransferase [Parcubacteria group bacterium GW2011_GWA2_47_26]